MGVNKHIYIAYTGGTIGMRPSEHGFTPEPGFLASMLEVISEFNRPEMPEYTLNEYQPLLDSSDMSPAYWRTIAADIAANYEAYDGFIILHGTDTMAYTASALSFIFNHLRKPIILTGSQIALAAPRSDGRDNLLNALYIAAYHSVPEVTLYFNHRLYRGNRVRKTNSTGFDAFTSPNYPPLIEAESTIKCNTASWRQPVAEEALEVYPLNAQTLSLLYWYPGLDLRLLESHLQAPTKAMVLMSYGLGNLPQSQGLRTLLQRAIDQQICVVNITQCMQGEVDMATYATGTQLADIGVISGGDMTPEAALTKLHFLLSQGTAFEALRQQMTVDLRGELSTL